MDYWFRCLHPSRSMLKCHNTYNKMASLTPSVDHTPTFEYLSRGLGYLKSVRLNVRPAK